MNLSRKSNIFSLIIVAVFVAAFAFSLSAITRLNKSASEIIGISREFNYLSDLRNTLKNLNHSIDHYLNFMAGSGHTKDIQREFSAFTQVVKASGSVKLDPEEKEILVFINSRLDGFSRMVEEVIHEGATDLSRKKLLYQKWKVSFIEKALQDISFHWEKDIDKINTLHGETESVRKSVIWTFSVTAAIIFLLLLGLRVFISRQVLGPLKTIEDAGNAIALGDITKRIEITSSDEMGSLAGSINSMAEAIDSKISELQGSIAKEQALVREQTILNELMSFIASGLDIELIVRTFLGRTQDLLKAEHSAIYILEYAEAGDEPAVKFFFNTFEEKTSMDCALAMLNGVFRNAVRSSIPLRNNTAMGEIPATHFHVKNLLAVPLPYIEKKVSGLIVLVNKEGGFSQEDEDSLTNFAFQAFQGITMQQEIMIYATTDGLTGLLNHRMFMKRLEAEMERSKRYARDLSLLMIDIDHFKSFNDIYGHQAGDLVLKNVARLITGNLRISDIPARYGGEEFAVILPETAGSQALVVAERMRNRIENYTFALSHTDQAHVTVSVGYATYPDDADDGDTLLKNSDQGLYLAKEGGRNRVSRYRYVRGKAEQGLAGEIREIMHNDSLAGFKELAKAIDAKSHFMRGHSFEVAAIAVRLGRDLKLPEDQIEGLRIASLLHDIGNLVIPDNILNKPSPLTAEEKKIIKSHPGLPEMLLKHHPRAEQVLPAILYHHERFDGKGYPQGMKGEEIPFIARILGAVEAYHAMVSARPYRKRKSLMEAIAEMEKEMGQQFDPLVTKKLINLLKKDGDPAEKREKSDT